VKGRPQLKLRSGQKAEFVSGSGSETLAFKAPDQVGPELVALELNGGAMVACEAGAVLRLADVTWPQ
jgi:hypothetical protein